MKIAYIMRGVPGSGKSTTALQITRGYENPLLEVAVHSTDDLFYVNDVYRFDPRKLAHHHALNLEDFKESVKRGVPCVICDNTNIRVKHYQPYVDAATEAGYRVAIVQLPHPTLEQAFNRNKHGVPRENIARMIQGFEPPVESKEQNYRLEGEAAARVAKHVTVYVRGVEDKKRLTWTRNAFLIGILVGGAVTVLGMFCGALLV